MVKEIYLHNTVLFKKKKGKMNGWRLIVIKHNTFDSLLKALDYEIEEDFKSYYLPDKSEEESYRN